MIRIVRHFATRLKRAKTRAHSTVRPELIDGAIAASAWEACDQWLALKPLADALAVHEDELASERARRAIVLIGQSGEEVVRRIAHARMEQRLVNEAGARFALTFARERGDGATRRAASVELAVLV